jgi:molecular chaperone HscB
MCNHLHCAGVSATRLSAGVFPSLIKPIVSIHRNLVAAIYANHFKEVAYLCVMNYFELFGFEEAPAIDKRLLSEKYFLLQKQNHPDFFTQASEAEQEQALAQSADINKAFTTFQNEDKTIEYFLQVKDIVATDEKYQLPNDFLMEMMEINETLEEKDGVTVTAELAEIEKGLYQSIEPVIKDKTLYNDAASLEKLKAYYYKKKYIQRILARLGD